MSTGKGDVTTDVQCTQACKDVCVPVPNKVCNDVPYQTQVRWQEIVRRAAAVRFSSDIQ